MKHGALDATTLDTVMSAVLAAPTVHHGQPWRLRADRDAGTIELTANTERQLPHADPVGRILLLAAGAALFNLRVAAAHVGWRLRLTTLPSPEHPEVLAVAQVADADGDRGDAVSAQRTDLYDALWNGTRGRFPSVNQPLPPAVVTGMEAAAEGEGARLRFADHGETRRLLALTAEAEARNIVDPERRDESRRWIHDLGSFGVSPVGPHQAPRPGLVDDLTALLHHSPPVEVYESNPILAVLSTAHDRRTDWLAAGEALEHARLVATRQAVHVSWLYQALEWADLRERLGDPDRDAGPVHMLVRLGYATPPGRLEAGAPRHR
ncbi:hypothetical protein [Streptomyces sp. B6B3]|uniref:hypothetical protein n=1 Tax=Streptomyces sp. B6B3 TaxID=3153570 RepID=UPI00325E5C2F